MDFRLVNILSKGDIAITQDYGLAAMCLGKGAYVLNQDGKEYTNYNISGLLEFRPIRKKIRRSGGRLKAIPKRTTEQDKQFESALDECWQSKIIISFIQRLLYEIQQPL